MRVSIASNSLHCLRCQLRISRQSFQMIVCSCRGAQPGYPSTGVLVQTTPVTETRLTLCGSQPRILVHRPHNDPLIVDAVKSDTYRIVSTGACAAVHVEATSARPGTIGEMTFLISSFWLIHSPSHHLPKVTPYCLAIWRLLP